jgi:hypothetical protein
MLDSYESSDSLLARSKPGEGAHCIHAVGHWEGHRSCLDALKKVKISIHFRELKKKKFFLSPNRPSLLTMHTDYFNTCIVYLLLFCTVTNKCTIISQMIKLLHVSTLSCHPQGA